MKGRTMEINSLNNLNFSAKINSRFKLAAEKYFNQEASRRNLSKQAREDFLTRNLDEFEAKVDAFKMYGTPDMEIRYQSNYIDPKDGKRKHVLFAHEDGQDDLIIAGKEHFRALLDRFYNINRKHYPQEEITYIVNSKRRDGDIMA